MAKPGFKFVVHHGVRLFEQVPITIYTNIPAATVKLIPEDSGTDSIKGLDSDTSAIIDRLQNWVQSYMKSIGAGKKNCRLEITFVPHTILSPVFNPIQLYTSVCAQLNEWMHHPKEKNEMLEWIIEENNKEDSDLIAACMYGGIMSTIGVRPFRIYQPKGLYFQLESQHKEKVSTIHPSKIPLFILALERSDYDTLFELIQETCAEGNIGESYLGALHLPHVAADMHVFNISTLKLSPSTSQSQLSEIFEIDSNGCSVI